MAYILGKVEGEGKNWHGHVTAVTVAPAYRRQGLAEKLMDLLEDTTIKMHNGYFVDLFVRVSNLAAIQMYEKFGYCVYRRVIGYYSNEEDAYGMCILSKSLYVSIDIQPFLVADMRKAMPRDIERESIVPLGRPIQPSELEFD